LPEKGMAIRPEALGLDGLVDAAWLMRHLREPDVVVLDCTNGAAWSARDRCYRTISGETEWRPAHIPESRHVDFTNRGLSGASHKYRNSLPLAQKFAAALGQLGVSADSRVVLYDDAGSQWACRVWLMLRWIGFDRAAVLDGGWQGWKAAGGPEASDSVAVTGTPLLPIRLRNTFITKQDLSERLAGGALLIDALTPEQYSGHKPALGLKGHIPGAINIPAESLLDLASKCFLPPAELARLFPAQSGRKTVVYCGSGIAASSVAFVLIGLGLSEPVLYLPGLQEWADDPQNQLDFG